MGNEVKTQMLFPHHVGTVSPNSILNFLLWNSLQNTAVVPLLLKEAVEMPWMQLQETSAAGISPKQQRDHRHEGKKHSSALPPYLAAQVALVAMVTDLLRPLGEGPLPCQPQPLHLLSPQCRQFLPSVHLPALEWQDPQ